MFPAPPPPAGPSVSLSEAAARRILALMQAENDTTLMLRLTVSGGGCAGFSTAFAVERLAQPGDRVFETQGARLVVDEASLAVLDGALIDFSEGLMSSGFVVRNPNATSTCGCGTSFSL
ncbi:heme biosynthesis protein HemY [Pararhodospirillum oryzae]|uniref:Heme biosynthesis protein HemY n=2 Tax=Pararhodospirillum oryzae TaxID=478448 RepID=A0A512HBH8_9PROT|nr:heme biosynthesis protein HemY [Pararhodospirillum oryzae]